jgi:asparagine synthase (glutamine-hydrolysing)
MQDIVPLRKLQRQKILPDDAVLINGNSGDFITGGHIPSVLTQDDLTEDTFYRTIIEKHFSLWLHLNPTIDLDRIREKIKQVLSEHLGVLDQRAADFELWEWQERQAKYVVNGQRTYDFLNVAWELPLWHDEYLHFWSAVPVALKYRQKLYADYLDSYDFKGLFKTFKPALWRWPGNAWLVIPLAQMLGICGGQKMKNRFYHYMKYFGHYSDQYAPFGYFHFLKHIGRARSGVSFFIQAWISENQDIFWDGMSERNRKHSIPRTAS